MEHPSNFHCEGTLRFIRQPVKCTTATGDNEASNCSQVKCCYFYANEGGSKNFISIKKSTHTFLEIPVLVFSFVWCWFCSCTWMYWAVCLKGRYGRMHSQMRSFCFDQGGCKQEVSIIESCFIWCHSKGTGTGVDGITQAWLKKNPLSGMSNLLGTHDRDTE